MSEHPGYEPHAQSTASRTNSRNGTGKKRLQTDVGEFKIEVPRDRDGSFEPQLVKKHQRRLAGFDDKVLSLYARGLSEAIKAVFPQAQVQPTVHRS